MGMIVCLLAIDERKANDFLEDSSELSDWLWSEEVQGSPELLDLDKSWHGIHYLLAGSAWDTDGATGQAIMGGKPFGDDLGMGPARMLKSDDVKETSKALSKLNHEDLKKNFDAPDMVKQDIYPAIWDRTEELDETFHGYLMPNFDALKEHYAKAAQEDKAMILYLT